MNGNRDRKGFTLVELLVVLALSAILAVVAVPSFITYLQNSRLNSAAQNLYYALQSARTQAVKTNTTVYVSFTTGSTWCYGINPNAVCTCNPNNCTLGSTQSPSAGQLTLTATGLTNSSVRFEPNHGAANASSTVTLTNPQGNSITVKVELLGSLLLCSSTIPGYQACT